MIKLLITIAAILLLGNAARAGSAYDEVNIDHWCYTALDYLQEQGYLQNYPEGYFQSKVPYQRAIFQFAIRELLHNLDDKTPADIRLMIETLSEEFFLGQGFSGMQMPDYTQEVPLDHWAYNAMDYIQERSFLQEQVYLTSFPRGVFRWDIPLTRYEFAFAIARLHDKLTEDSPESLRLLARVLSMEFYDQVRGMVDPMHGPPLSPRPDWQNEIDAVLEAAETSGYVSQEPLTGAYSDVPHSHWAYDALQHFIDNGILEGYPDDFFNRDRILTGYEFAQATARLLDTMNHMETVDPCDNQIIEILRSEFSFQLAFMNAQLDELEGQIQWLDASDNDAELQQP